MADNADWAARQDEFFEQLRERERRARGVPVNTTGYCEDCENEIPKERLQKQPNAIRCVDCQAHKERTDKLYAR